MREKEKRELINYHKNDLIIILLTHHIFVDVMASKIYIFFSARLHKEDKHAKIIHVCRPLMKYLIMVCLYNHGANF